MLSVDLFVYFLSVHIDLARRLDTEANLVATDFNNRDLDHVIDDDAFVFLPREYKHCEPVSLWASPIETVAELKTKIVAAPSSLTSCHLSLLHAIGTVKRPTFIWDDLDGL